MNSRLDEEMDAAHKSWWQTFEVVFGIPFLVAIVLRLVAPLPLPQGLHTLAIILVGMFFVIVGITLIILARREFAQYGQPTDPGHPTSKLITTGVFSISRNPLYLGGVCILVGIALVFNIAWVLMLLFVAFVICHYVLIVPEERYLAANFGAEYHSYAASVCRWIGRARQ